MRVFARNVVLRDGRAARLEGLVPPLPPEEASAFSALVRSTLDEPFLDDLLTGRVGAGLDVLAVASRVEGTLAGTAWMGRGQRCPDIGVIAGVVTRPDLRGQGLAAAACAALCRAFDEEGGRYLFLAAATPDAARLYGRLGFRRVAGAAMCRARDGTDFRAALAAGRPGTARDADWGDLPAMVPLYYLPHECVLLDAGAPLASARVAGPVRCVGLFWNTWLTTVAAGGLWQALPDGRGWMAAGAVARPDGENLSADFIWAPFHADAGRAFLADFLREAERRLGRPCRLLLCEGDAWKEREAQRLGFTRVENTGAAVEVAGRRRRLIVRHRT